MHLLTLDKKKQSPFAREVDPYDDDTLRRLAPEAFGSLGFDPVTAQLLVRGYFVPPNAAAALKIRIEAELTGHHPLRGHHGQKRKKQYASGSNDLSAPAPKPATAVNNGPGDRSPWDDEKTEIVVDLHAKRVSFKMISVCDHCYDCQLRILLSSTNAGTHTRKGRQGLPGALLQGSQGATMEGAA